MKYAVAIVGSKEEIMGFGAVGVQTHEVETDAEGGELLLDLKKQAEKGELETPLAVVFVMERIIKSMDKESYERLSEGALPAFIPLPGSEGSSGFGNEKIRRIVEKAVGSDIFGEG